MCRMNLFIDFVIHTFIAFRNTMNNDWSQFQVLVKRSDPSFVGYICRLVPTSEKLERLILSKQHTKHKDLRRWLVTPDKPFHNSTYLIGIPRLIYYLHARFGITSVSEIFNTLSKVLNTTTETIQETNSVQETNTVQETKTLSTIRLQAKQRLFKF